MKKHVLNIERIYSGQTSNALVLSQVDAEFPRLLPSIDREDSRTFHDWIVAMKEIFPEFNPFDVDFQVKYTKRKWNDDRTQHVDSISMKEFKFPQYIENTVVKDVNSEIRACVISELQREIVDLDHEEVLEDSIPEDIGFYLVGQYVIESNLEIQRRFRKMGRERLYMMDDTQRMNPYWSGRRTLEQDKTDMHLIHGIGKENLLESGVDDVINSSQMNVLFPYEKVQKKSLYSEELDVRSALGIDEKMESFRQMSLQQFSTSDDTVVGTAGVGGNLYSMSALSSSYVESLVANGFACVSSFLDDPFCFPTTMTLFQPSGGRNEEGSTGFVQWYKQHNRHTVVHLYDEYGGSTSKLDILGPGSYELWLSTYCPSQIVVGGSEYIPLNAQKFQEIRNEEDPANSYEIVETDSGIYGKYVLDNGAQDREGRFLSVGLMFNLYDTFITGNSRNLEIDIPVDRDFNDLNLRFRCKVRHSTLLVEDFEYYLYVGQEKVFSFTRDDAQKAKVQDGFLVFPYDGLDDDGSRSVELKNMSISGRKIELKVVIHYNVDFTRRNSEQEYRDMLSGSGLVLEDLRIDDGRGIDPSRQYLTFGDYANENGISELERQTRLYEFWKVSKYKRNIPYQTILETSLTNKTSSGIEYHNNYSTGDMYGDVVSTKTVLDPLYDMNISSGVDDSIVSLGRRYIGIGQCSNQLFLKYRPAQMLISDEDGTVKVSKLESNDTGYGRMKYQMVEVVKSINRFESSVKHKSNVFSIVVQNSNLAEDESADADSELELRKDVLRNSVRQFVRDMCEGVAPAHTQLFDVQFV